MHLQQAEDPLNDGIVRNELEVGVGVAAVSPGVLCVSSLWTCGDTVSASRLCASGTSHERIYRLVFISATLAVGLYR